MILNSWTILVAFVALLRLLCGVVVLGLGVCTWCARGRPVTPTGPVALEDRGYLVLLLTLLLVGLNLASWPLLYLMLQSYVVEWPGVMCIYGVTQVGKGSLGSARFLPTLLLLLQLTTPALVFAGGAWFVLYLLNRQTRTGPLLQRLFVALLPLGALAAVDATAELTYVAIPKKEVYPPGGCCVVAHEDAERFVPPILFGEASRPWLFAAYYTTNLSLILALIASTRRPDHSPSAPGLALLLVGGAVVLLASGLFLVSVAAPALLQLPYHHCPYDLLSQAPEAVVAVTLFLGAGFFLGWACVARCFGSSPQTEPFLPGMVWALLRLSLAGYVMSLAMLSLELALA
jgi:hypothetical protein